MSANIHLYLTDEVIERAKAPPSGETRLWDIEFKGFLVRIWPSGPQILLCALPAGTQARTLHNWILQKPLDGRTGKSESHRDHPPICRQS